MATTAGTKVQVAGPGGGASRLRIQGVAGLGQCALLDRGAAIGDEILREAPLLATIAPFNVDEALVEEAMRLCVREEDEGKSAEGGDQCKEPRCWRGLPLWSGAALSGLAARRLLGLLASYAASPIETRRAVLELDDSLAPRSAAARLLRQLADVATVWSSTCLGLRKAEARCVLRVAWVNAFPFGGEGAALFALASRCAHGCWPNAFYTSDAGVGKVVALREIPMGGRIELCYVPRHYTLLPMPLRRRYLRFVRGFTCRCELCLCPDEPPEPAEQTAPMLVPLPSCIDVGRPPRAPLHVCCCVSPWAGHMLQMLRVARALADRLDIARVTYLTNAFGATKVRNWLLAQPDPSQKIRLVDFEDGYDKAMDDEINQRLTCDDDVSVPDANLLIEVNVGVHLDRLVNEDRIDYFVVDWYSYGFSKHLTGLGTDYCVSMPTSEFLAQYLQLDAGGLVPPKCEGAMMAMRQGLHGHPVLVHCLPDMVTSAQNILGAHTIPTATNLWTVGLIAVPAVQVPLPADVEAFLSQPGPPILYVSMGTMVQITGPQLHRLIEGLSAPGEWRVVWSLKKEMMDLLPGELGEDFFVSSWLPQMEIMDHPSCAAALLHCGWGATCEAIACGKPVCAFPMFGDHSINAAMLSHMGMAKIVGLQRGACTIGHQPLKTFDASGLRTDIRNVLSDPTFVEAARRWRDINRSSPGGPEYMAELIEGFARHPNDYTISLGSATEPVPAETESAREIAEAGFAASVVAFAECQNELTFDDRDTDGDDLPRGVRLEQLFERSAALLGHGHYVTEWLLRLRVYRDFMRFCAAGPAVIRYLALGDVLDFANAAVAAHNALLGRRVPLGLASPLLDGEPHRPTKFASGLLSVADALAERLAETSLLPEVALTSGVASQHSSDGTTAQVAIDASDSCSGAGASNCEAADSSTLLLKCLLSHASMAVKPAWWELLGDLEESSWHRDL